jgi:hypothetical protein
MERRANNYNYEDSTSSSESEDDTLDELLGLLEKSKHRSRNKIKKTSPKHKKSPSPIHKSKTNKDVAWEKYIRDYKSTKKDNKTPKVGSDAWIDYLKYIKTEEKKEEKKKPEQPKTDARYGIYESMKAYAAAKDNASRLLASKHDKEVANNAYNRFIDWINYALGLNASSITKEMNKLGPMSTARLILNNRVIVLDETHDVEKDVKDILKLVTGPGALLVGIEISKPGYNHITQKTKLVARLY